MLSVDRVLKISDGKKVIPTTFHPPSLELLSIRSVISTRNNFFEPGYLPEMLQDYISNVFTQFNICGFCNAARPSSDLGLYIFIST